MLRAAGDPLAWLPDAPGDRQRDSDQRQGIRGAGPHVPRQVSRADAKAGAKRGRADALGPLWTTPARFAFDLFTFQALFMKNMMGGTYLTALRRSHPEWLSMNMTWPARAPP
jgi:hypothetical protein